ncbi:malate dehydrogenase, NAD-dependent [Ehrlichia chaffeensis str. Heartland]|uniref:Malate dehydrogenase n=1 Tax=Ehrlichia chaffeensis (strain ATCC CRL-10679 / Arkansas) TaxID=205920 RepID=MDH_EHRCR|nr:malate dehydrogenase [Ehrlichia chaffeensis]Q2GGI2.1 RecName: Full=Malate dehydrogenase [Ehrlichia chaffeensis str. Arkansas]ABD44535.1 malate dehydrogenase, NAD-dependent [Ehrlichia chaffeensis str. Arkansas]AHX03722.1 malate dehydrogenase, NAD-dependent [Ehrlichia chaffeensis str. Heartland]AHX05557.1 malate dehydrogenase, NAD-dependent [Ehrlichia chaffeensis str. Jax]AHX06547.1 malate dehydrogenase, NAD-dependent [Ehrlichia chaffeensis str. Liberty]AHX07248.1 malate dehydrogenase, NAD-d
MIKRKKIALIGAGSIGGMIAYLVRSRNLGDVVLLDVNGGIAKGKALDIAESSPVAKHNGEILGTNNYADIEGADAIIVTAGISRKPGMSRDDLINTNVHVIKEVAENIAKYAPNAFVVVVTNPLDIMVLAMHKYSHLPSNMVVGMAGVLDAARFSYFIAKELNVSVDSVSSIVLGGHGDFMLPLVKYSSVGGISIADLVKMNLITQDRVNEIIEKTRKGGEEIVNLLKVGSAYYAPAESALLMVDSYLNDRRLMLSCSVYLKGEYGVHDLFVGVPVIIGKNGVEKVIELQLTEEEKNVFNDSVMSIRKLVSNI